MVTIEERDSLIKNDFKLSYLKFWTETSLYEFDLNTVVESPHEDKIGGLLTINLQSTHSISYILAHYMIVIKILIS